MTRRSVIVYWLLVLAFASAGIILLGLFAVPFQYSKAWVNSLAQDGSVELFNLAFTQSVRLPCTMVGVLFIALLVWMLWKRRYFLTQIEAAFQFMGRLGKRLSREFKELWQDIRGSRLARIEFAILLAVLLIAVFARAALIMRPMAHDESYTVVVFASGSLRDGLSDYHHPNNHLFHTLLVHYGMKLFGMAPWSVRMPAFLAGVLLIPAVYFFTRTLHGRWAAALAAGLAAVYPGLIYMSTNARGYTLIALLTLLILMLAVYVLRHKSVLGWALLVLASALGFYTIPIFLFSYAVMLAWVLAAVWLFDLQKEAYGSKWAFLRWLVISGLFTGLITLLLYSPVVIRYGGFAILRQDIPVQQSFGDFTAELRSRLQDNYADWMRDLPSFAAVIAGLGVLLALLVPAKGESRQTKLARLLPYATLASSALVVFVLRVNIYSRFVSFIIPLIIIWIAAGWIGLLERLARGMHRKEKAYQAVTLIALAAICVISVVQVVNSPYSGINRSGDVEKLAWYLRDHLQDNDLVVVSPPHDAEVWYYSRLNVMDMDHYKRELPFFRAYIMVDPFFGQTVESVLVERGPELFFFDDLSSAKLVFQSGPVQLYELIPNVDLVRKEYKVP